MVEALPQTIQARDRASRALRRAFAGSPSLVWQRGLRVLWWIVSLQIIPRARDWYRAGQPRRSAEGAIAPTPPGSLDAILAARFPALRPLHVFNEPGAGRRLTMLTDSISASSLFGGVGTAVLLAVCLARHWGCPLRLVTRTDPPDAAKFAALVALHGVTLSGNVDLLHCSSSADGRALPVRDGDLILTTSWWTTWAALQSLHPARILYLLQEDERMFYPAGDEQCRCAEILSDERLTFIVNTSLLFRHFELNGPAAIARHGVSFEPSFPARVYHRRPRPAQSRRRFFFYARPNHVRNLFYLGLETVFASIEAGVLAADTWDFYFVGRDLPSFALPRGANLILRDSLSWDEYAELAGTIDLALSLMATPHPSYPPLDLAASGAVVVTNRFGIKQSLQSLSPNILCVEPNVADLVDGLRQAVAMLGSASTHSRETAAPGLLGDWEASFRPVLEFFAPATQR